MHDVHLVDFIVLDVPSRQTKIVGQRWRITIHVDEQDAPQRLATNLGQPRLVSNELRIERFLIRDALELAVATKLPPMKRTGEARKRAPLVQGYAITPMRTDVVERLDPAVDLANDDELLAAHRECEVITVFGNVARHPGQQPDARPKTPPFQLHELARVVTSGIDDLQPIVDVRLLGFERLTLRTQAHGPLHLVVDSHRAPLLKVAA